MYNKNTCLQFPQSYNGHHDVVSGYYVTSNPPNLDLDVAAAAAWFGGFNDHDMAGGVVLPNDDVDPSTTTANSFPKKQSSSKKDRHSKIYTAQGPRDRRVRLSIGIARKFFDLQEMLGFDKPSKTLDWLLTKSKEAIKELVRSKSNNNNSSSSPSEEVLSTENSFGPDFKGKAVVKPVGRSNKCRGGKEAIDLAKESRAKARARARERTKEKMCVKHLTQAINHKGYDQHPPLFGFHHQNLGGGSRDYLNSSLRMQSENYVTHDNWDYSNQLCAILDQHKFIN